MPAILEPIMMSLSQTEPCPACGAVLDVTGAQIFAERTCPVCSTGINVRRKFGHYELMDVVGHGGQGLVYKAIDNNLNRLVALKLLRTEYAKDPEFVRQFESEAHITASINHPNVVRVFSFGADEGHVYLAMELVAKGTLDDLMEKLRRVPEARALQIGIEIAQGLRAGHECGLVHRDVKPGNVLFGEDGSAKVVDFGLAMFLEQAAADSGEIWGTPYYLSPERLNRVKEDFRSDIYSLGATLFHAIAGRPPFEAEDSTGVAMKHLNATAVSIQSWAPDVTNATAFVINRTLSKNPDERYASYEEFIEQLQFAREEALAKAHTGPTAQKSRVVIEDAGSRKANSLVTIATLLVLVLGIGIGWWVVSKSQKNTPATVEDFSSLSAFGPGWIEARDQLAKGDSAQAIESFRGLAESSSGDKRAWAVIFQALSHQLAGNIQGASSALGKIDGSTPHGKFFADFAPTLASTAAVTAKSAEAFSLKNYESVATLFLAIKAYQSGDTEVAAVLFRQFTTGHHSRNYEFLSEFKKVARPFEDEFTTFGMVTAALTSAKSQSERKSAVTALKDFQAKLRPNSRLAAKVNAALASVDKGVAAEAEKRRKSNLAATAVVSVSGWNQGKDDKPEFAVDGDLTTRWSSGSSTAKWIQFDLGSPKVVGRWALRLAPPPAQGQKIHRIRDFKLEHSSDQAAWTIADEVFGNRADGIDRVIKPFTARYVRISIPVGSWDPKEKAARVFEVELTDAAAQAKAAYDPSDDVAVRFSPDSPLALTPVGPMTASGTATFDAKNGRYVIKGSGEDIWLMTDSFHYAQQAIEGDFEIIARVTKVEGPHPWSKAGIMVRTDFSKDSTHAMMVAGPGEKAQFLSRKDHGKAATSVNLEKRKLPLWFKLVRTGPVITGFESADGQAWSRVSAETPTGMGPIAIVGLVMCSHQAGALGTGEFDNVSINPSK